MSFIKSTFKKIKNTIKKMWTIITHVDEDNPLYKTRKAKEKLQIYIKNNKYNP